MFYLLRVTKPYGYSNATVWNKAATPTGRNKYKSRAIKENFVLFKWLPD